MTKKAGRPKQLDEEGDVEELTTTKSEKGDDARRETLVKGLGETPNSLLVLEDRLSLKIVDQNLTR